MGDAWGVWKLRHGSATRMLDAHKRADLERTLERFFSKWAWAWDVEGQHTARVIDAPERAGLVAETLALSDAAPGPKLDCPMELFSQTDTHKPSVLVVHDDAILWPPLDAPFSSDDHAIVAHVLGRLGGLQAVRELEEATRRRAQAQDAPEGVLDTTIAGLGRMWSGMAMLGEQAASYMPWQGHDMQQVPAQTWSLLRSTAKPARALFDSAAALTGAAAAPAQPPRELERAAASAPAVALDVSATMQSSMDPAMDAASMLSSLHEDGRLKHARSSNGVQDEGAPSLAADVHIDDPASGTAFAALHSRLAEELDETSSTDQEAPAPVPAGEPERQPTWSPPAPVAAVPWHDFALDGWGHEDPAPWKSEQLHAADGSPLYISYTRRGRLTAILVWTAPCDSDQWLEPTWELLRRTQRVINDTERHPAPDSPPYLFVGANGLSVNELGSAEEATSATEASLLDAEHVAERYVAADQTRRTRVACTRREWPFLGRHAHVSAGQDFYGAARYTRCEYCRVRAPAAATGGAASRVWTVATAVSLDDHIRACATPRAVASVLPCACRSGTWGCARMCWGQLYFPQMQPSQKCCRATACAPGGGPGACRSGVPSHRRGG